jgi:hypothetical protein
MYHVKNIAVGLIFVGIPRGKTYCIPQTIICGRFIQGVGGRRDSGDDTCWILYCGIA